MSTIAETSRVAYEALDAASLQLFVLKIIRRSGKYGMIHDDVMDVVEQEFGFFRASSSITPRYALLYRKGLIEYDGKRLGMRGRGQRVMVATGKRHELERQG